MRVIPGGVLACVSLLLIEPDPAFAANYSPSARVLHKFSQNDKKGFNPHGTLVRGADGAFYGTTAYGGVHGNGTVYRIQSDGRGFTVLHQFHESRNPISGVTEGRDGFLYGTTESGGNRLQGTVFKIGKDGKGFTTLYHFTGVGHDGNRPQACVTLDSDGVCYGTTTGGGPHLNGTVFRIDSNGSGYRVLYTFVGKQRADGSTARSAMLLASDGALYGTTANGGQHDLGTIFTIQRNGRSYRVLHAFTGRPSDGATPYASLIEGSDGKLYGTTVSGGNGAQGTVFAIAKDGKGYQILRSFSGLKNDGRNPYGPLVEGKDAQLYSTTLNGGPDGSGLIFRIARDGRDYAPVFFFSLKGPEGRWPHGGVVLDESGAIYGTTTSGASENQGTIFKLDTVPR